MTTTDRRGAIVDGSNPSDASTPHADLAIKTACRLATTGNINLSTTGLSAIDGVTPANADRILVKNQTVATQNGIYSASTGVWQRTTDADSNTEWASGVIVWVTSGTVNAGTLWGLTTANTITIGTSSLTFVRTPSDEDIIIRSRVYSL